MSDRSTVTRAFELARSGQCRTMDDLRRKLTAEGCDQVAAHLSSGALKRQLIDAMKLLE